jgi:hypothetical protein
MIDLAKLHQEDVRQADAWEDILSEKLANQHETTMSEVWTFLGLKVDRLDKPTQTRLGLAMQALGWERKQVRNGHQRTSIYRRKAPPVTT